MTTKRGSNEAKKGERLSLKRETVKDLDPRDAQLKGGALTAPSGGGPQRCTTTWSGCSN
jgi:hypothetical protein